MENHDEYMLIDKFQQQYSSCLHVFYRMLSKDYKKYGKIKSEFEYLSNTSELSLKLQQLNNVELMQTNTWIYRSCIKEAISMFKKNKHVVFGGKKNLEKRKKNKITKDDWKECRKYPIYSVGTAKPYKGNQKFELLNDLETVVFKPTRKLHINVKLCNVGNRIQILKKIFEIQNSKQYPITYKLSKDYIWISVDECVIYDVDQHTQISNRVMSIDMNPNYIGWSIVDWKSSYEFNIIKTGSISFKKINDMWFELNKDGSINCNSVERKYVCNKINYEVYQVCKKLIDIAIYYQVQIFGIEDLKFTRKKQPKKKSKKKKNFNTLCQNLWVRNTIVTNLTKRCNIHYIRLLKVQAQYSSIYGNLVFRSLNLPDPVLASIEIGRRTYEFYNQYIIKTKQETKNIIQPFIGDFTRFYVKALEEFNVNDKVFGSWYELYSYMKSKNSDINWYRVSLNSINNLKFCRLFSQNSLLVNITNNS